MNKNRKRSIISNIFLFSGIIIMLVLLILGIILQNKNSDNPNIFTNFLIISLIIGGIGIVVGLINFKYTMLYNLEKKEVKEKEAFTYENILQINISYQDILSNCKKYQPIDIGIPNTKCYYQKIYNLYGNYYYFIMFISKYSEQLIEKITYDMFLKHIKKSIDRTRYAFFIVIEGDIMLTQHIYDNIVNKSTVGIINGRVFDPPMIFTYYNKKEQQLSYNKFSIKKNQYDMVLESIINDLFTTNNDDINH